MTTREVRKTITGRQTKDGAGVKLIRVLGNADVRDIDPFLMLDAFDATDPDDYIRGFPMHPHRGIETITYLIDGQIDHRDSLGNKGSVLPGEAQWMTAGRGIMHEEMPQRSNRMWGLQIWLNLAAKEKMTAPAYFDIKKDMIREVPFSGGRVLVLAGEFNGVKGVEPPHAKARILDVFLESGWRMILPTNEDDTLFVYLFEGEGCFGSEHPQIVAKRTVAVFTPGESLHVQAGSEGLRFMAFQGHPLKEPIAWMGPIVMNTDAELQLAHRQLQDGTFITP